MPRQTGPAPEPTAPTPVTYEELIGSEATKVKVPIALALAVTDRESKFDVNARSPKGAIGLMQLMPDTARRYGKDPTDIVQNVQAGVAHLRFLLDRYQNDWEKTLAAYNAGEGAVDKHGGIPPFAETQAYVPAVMRLYRQYLTRFPSQETDLVPPARGRGTGAGPGPGFAPYRIPGRGQGPPVDYARYKPPTGLEPEPATGLVSGFAEGAWRTGVVEPAQGVLAMGQRLIEENRPEALARLTPQERVARSLPGGPLAPMAAELLKGGLQAHWNQAVQAKQAYDEGRWGDVILHGAGTVIPFLGPAAAEIIEKGQQSGDWSTATGELTGTFGPNLLKAFKFLPSQRTIVGVPKTYGERTGSTPMRFLERLTERTVTGSSRFQQFRMIQQQALQGMGDRIVQRLNQGGALPSRDIGMLVERGLTQARDQVQATLRAMYGAIDQQVQTHRIRVPQVTQQPSLLVGPQGQPLTVPVRKLVTQTVGPAFASSTPLKKVAIGLLRRIRDEAQLISPTELKRSADLLETIIRSPKRLPFGVYQDARSDLLKIVRSHGDLLPGKAAGIAKQLVEETDNAMIEAARSSGIPGLEADVRAANAFRADAEVFNEAFIKKLVETAGAERVPDMIRGMDIAEISSVRGLLQPQQWQAVQARIMQDLFEESTRGEMLSGSQVASRLATHGTLRPAITPHLQVNAFEKALERLGREKIDTLFGPQAFDDLMQVVAEGKLIAPAQGATITQGLMAAGVNGTIMAPFLGPLGNWISWPYSAGTGGSFWALSQLMTHPEGFKTWRRFAGAVSRGNRPLAMTLGLQLTRDLNEIEAQRETPPVVPRVQAQPAPLGAPATPP
jgi:hypothetical protein